jgi:3-deoxy-7-phosphoheptulonate synthase
MKDISTNDIKLNIPLVTRKEFDRKIFVNGLKIGGKGLTIMAGPCTVESKSQIFEIAKAVKEAGAKMMRGGVFKPLTFPYGDPLGVADSDSNEASRDRNDILSKSEQYREAERRFGYFKEAGVKYGLPIISEILYADSVAMMSEYVDMFQIGYRHMFNMDLIQALVKTQKPIMIKRHYGESLRSLLGVAEHFEVRRKHNFVFCERGACVPHTHNMDSRAILDIQAIPALKEYAPTVPVIIDPSHATFRRDYVAAMSKAAIAAGADGLLIEVHPTPEKAWIDPLQALDFVHFEKLMKEIDGIASVIGRTL